MKITTKILNILLGVILCAHLGNAQISLTVDARSNIFGAGQLISPSLSGGGGVLPEEIVLAEDTKFIAFPNISGMVSCCSGATTFNGPDGGEFASGSTNVFSLEGISGIIHNDRTMFLVGVLLDDTPPSTVGKGGNGTLLYSINGVDFQAIGLFDNLSAGNYTIEVQDGNNCIRLYWEFPGT